VGVLAFNRKSEIKNQESKQPPPQPLPRSTGRGSNSFLRCYFDSTFTSTPPDVPLVEVPLVVLPLVDEMPVVEGLVLELSLADGRLSLLPGRAGGCRMLAASLWSIGS